MVRNEITIASSESKARIELPDVIYFRMTRYCNAPPVSTKLGRTQRLAIVVLQSSSNRLEHLRQYFPALALALEKIKSGEIVQVW
jgi:hypothetical protein